VLSTNNTLDAKVNLNDSNASNYVLSTSNIISTRITNLTTDMITENINGIKKFIVNNSYNNNLLVNGNLTINSNLIVYGESTRLETTVYTTERLEVVNANNGSVALMAQQMDNFREIFIASNINSRVLTITNSGDVNIIGNYKKNNRDVIDDTSNYVLTTSNYLVNYNNLINKPTIPSAQVNSDWNSVSGSSQILNKPDLTIIATNNTNISNYVLTTSNYLVNYNNLINKPTIPAAQVNSDWNSVSGFSQILNKPDLTVITTNDTNISNYVLTTSNYLVNYNNLINKPDLTIIATNNTNISNYVLATSNYFVQNGGATQINSDWNSVSGFSQILNKPDLTVIATNNTNISNYVLTTSNYLVNYNNLINKPTIPAAQVNSDWNSVSGSSQILNKPDLTVITTNNTNLSNYVLATSNYFVQNGGATQINSDWNSVSGFSQILNKPDLTVITTNNTNLSNYVLATSNYFVLNGGGGATQINSDWNSVSGFSQILNKPDLTVIATNNTNLSNYVLATSNYFVLNGGGGGSTSTYWTLAGTTNAYFNLAGNVGIGTTNPAQKLHVVGDIASTGKVTSYYSDERLKTNISNISNSLDIINNIKGFYYEPNEIAISLGIKNRGREVGLSAQDVNKMVPEVVSLAPIDIHRDLHNNLVSKSGSNYLTVNYERLIPILVESIKELNIQITQLKLENAEFRKENAEFRAFKDRISKYYE
jgi:hypothetical protein